MIAISESYPVKTALAVLNNIFCCQKVIVKIILYNHQVTVRMIEEMIEYP